MSGAVDPIVGSLTTRYTPAGPLDLRLTLRPLRHGAGDPSAHLMADGGWLAFHTPRGSVTLALTQRPDGDVVAHAWGEGAEWAINSVPQLCGAGDEDDGVDLRRHPAVAHAAARFPGLRLTRSNRVLDALVPAVLEQEITATEALGAWQTLVRQHGTPAPGPMVREGFGVVPEGSGAVPEGSGAVGEGFGARIIPSGLRVAPTAAAWAAMPSWDFRQAGITQRRWNLVQLAASRQVQLERTLRLGRGGPEVDRVLRALPGIGVWTSALIRQRAHGDPDAPAFGDAHISRGVCWVLAKELLPAAEADQRMAELLEPWAGQRQRVVALLLAAGAEAPRRGPRASIPTHR